MADALDKTARELLTSMIERGLPVEAFAVDHPAVGALTVVVARGPAARRLQAAAFDLGREALVGQLALPLGVSP